MALIQLEGKQVHYTTGGKAWTAGHPVVVFLHGAAQNQSVWVMQSRALAHGGWNVASFDLPGHGQSENLPAITTVGDYAAWLAKALTTIGVEQATVVGHSMGGCIAVQFAVDFPERVSSLILLGMNPTMPVNDFLLTNSLENPMAASRFIAVYGLDQRQLIGGAPNPGNWLAGQMIALNQACAPEVYHRDFSACNNWDGSDLVKKITVKTLVISGARDRMTPARKAGEMAGDLPQGQFLSIPGAGHGVMSEAPRQTLAAMRKFLA